MNTDYFVTGIDTDSGKTLVSAILCKALKYDYWKPIQAGLPRDTDTVQELSAETIAHEETYLLRTPASPHAAAKIDNVEIDLKKISRPLTKNNLIIEGAGGCLVPLNNTKFVIDIPKQLNIPVILVANLYLGSINHTLLSVNFLKSNNYHVKGIIFNGQSNPESEAIILKHSEYKCLLRILKEEKINKEIVEHYATILKEHWND